MSVIIKGMEMPKSCQDCPLNYDQMACIVTGTRWWSDTIVITNFDSEKERLFDCPLIEVKEPHGDLVDRGWVRDSINHSCWLEHNDYLEAIGIIDDAPNVIEAEGNEE